jgi:dolichol-phosphate mannosyltransferase
MPELSVILPTYNERKNVEIVLECLSTALQGIDYEVIFVDDDSRDGTADAVRAIAQRDRRVRLVHRVNRRGLSSACLEGMLSSSAPYLAVMDADLQHDERILPTMLRRLKEEQLDIVVGSRNVEGGSMGEFSKARVALSTLGRRFSESVCRCEVTDPMSGFFVLRSGVLQEVAHRTSGLGFKILVDLLASSPRPLKLGEVPYVFRSRQHGESKLDIMVAVEYLQLVIEKLVGNVIPSSFVLFGLVGGVGALIHLTTLRTSLTVFRASFMVAQGISTVVAMTFNFLLNNLITYRDRKLKGWPLIRGLLTFYAACSIGVYINLRFSAGARGSGASWFFAGLFGLVLGSIWNYGVTQIFTWRTIRRVTQERADARLSMSKSFQQTPDLDASR